MMAAAQPFLSGAISKTVNLPNTATVEDIMQTYIESWKMGLKAVAIYRDGSKRSAPLNVKKNKDMGTPKWPRSPPSPPRWPVIASPVPKRRRMSDTRISITHKFDIAGHEGYLTVGLFDDNKSPGELFITMAKEGSTIGGLMDTIGTLVSLALQYGVPIDAMVKKFAHTRFRAERLHQEPPTSALRSRFPITSSAGWATSSSPAIARRTTPTPTSRNLPIKEIREIEKKNPEQAGRGIADQRGLAHRHGPTNA